MTIRELIEELEKYPKDMSVIVEDCEYGIGEPTCEKKVVYKVTRDGYTYYSYNGKDENRLEVLVL